MTPKVTPRSTVSGRHAVVVLDDPDRRNALGPDDLHALVRMLDEIERDEAVGVLVLRATGTTFCAGYDLRALRDEIETGQSRATAQLEFGRVVDTLERLRVPTVCAIDGGAYGGGADLALACDFRIGTPRASVMVPAARFGLQFYYGGLRRSVERLGLDAAKRVFLLAETIDAPDLLRLGFLHELVAEKDLDARIEAVTHRLLENERDAVRGLKRSLGDIASGSGRPEEIDDAFASSLRSPETVRRLAASRRSSN